MLLHVFMQVRGDLEQAFEATPPVRLNHKPHSVFKQLLAAVCEFKREFIQDSEISVVAWRTVSRSHKSGGALWEASNRRGDIDRSPSTTKVWRRCRVLHRVSVCRTVWFGYRPCQ
jgi:hypothetical protein